MTKKVKPEETSEKKKFSLIDELLDWLLPICKTFTIVVLTFTFVIRTASVQGQSMEPTLHESDRLILWSFCYSPKQGDIIAANCEGLGKIIVKRVIAVGGQEVNIDFDAGKVYVDGELFEVDGLENITTDRESAYNYPITVPKGKYFVMGDNRQHSTDSRSSYVGFVDREDILGKAVLRTYPFNKFGSLYKSK